VCADDGNGNNNTNVSSAIAVSVSTQPDYVISSPVFTSSGTPSGFFSGSFTITNSSSVSGTQLISWSVYRSLDAVYDPGVDTLVFNGVQPFLNAGITSGTINYAGAWPAGTGNYYLIIVIDATDDGNTGNNSSISSAIAVGYPDYAVSAVTITSVVSPYQEGSALTGSFTVTNSGSVIGTAASWQIWVCDTVDCTGASNLQVSGATGSTNSIISGGNQGINFSGTWPTGSNGTTRYLIAKLSTPPTNDNNVTNNLSSTTAITINKWKQETATTPWTARAEHTSVVHNGKIYVMGGATFGGGFKNDVWSSVDGINWVQETAAAPWAARRQHSSVVHNGKIYVIGGYASGIYKNDVWSSINGVNWVQETAAAPWAARSYHKSVVYNGKIYVIGGSTQNTVTMYNDVWSSIDGVNWVQETATAGWSKRLNHTCVVYNGKIYVIGGGLLGGGVLNDVWSSVDGVNWVQEITAAPWAARCGHTCVEQNGKIYVMGGVSTIYYNDVWSSVDGVSWVQETAASWVTRYGHTSVVYIGKVFVMGGSGGGSVHNDVWSAFIP